jgi:glycosyltransferase involved in cell wall biosynthesis
VSAPAFRPCILVPIYDHGSTIRGLVQALAPFGLPLYVVDDGSHAETRQALAGVQRDFPALRLHRRERNGGKGAAVMDGFRLARAEGMTHALQIDADGQHDVRDVPRFVERARSRPEALVAGYPVFDASVPKARLYGRSITNFWVCIETLSCALRDAQCGFRCYPLARACALIDRVSIPPRMDFDIAIAVRLIWEGVPVENLATRVTYPPGGVSHFRMLGDNARISRSHAALFFGMLARLPRLLARRRAGAAQP